MKSKSNNADFTGLRITDLTASGSSDDGEHVWITYRLGDGSEYPLIYPYEAVGYLITVLTDVARSAYSRRVARNPQEAVEGADSNVIPVRQLRVGTSPDNAGVILHMTTADSIPIAVELPADALAGVAQELQRVLANLRTTPAAKKLLH